MPLGQYGRKRPPSFSLLPRCQGEGGLHKEVRETCPLQLPEPGHFRTVIKRQSLPRLWWQLAQTRHKRLARGGGRLVLKPGQHQTDLCASCNWVALPGLLQHRPDPPPLPKAGFAGNRLRPPGHIDTPGQPASPRSYLLCRLRQR